MTSLKIIDLQGNSQMTTEGTIRWWLEWDRHRKECSRASLCPNGGRPFQGNQEHSGGKDQHKCVLSRADFSLLWSGPVVFLHRSPTVPIVARIFLPLDGPTPKSPRPLWGCSKWALWPGSRSLKKFSFSQLQLCLDSCRKVRGFNLSNPDWFCQ